MKVKPRLASFASRGRGLWQFQPAASAAGAGAGSAEWLQPRSSSGAGPPCSAVAALGAYSIRKRC